MNNHGIGGGENLTTREFLSNNSRFGNNDMQTQQSLNVTDFLGLELCCEGFILSRRLSSREALRVSMCDELLALARSAISPKIIAFLLVVCERNDSMNDFE